MRKFLFFLVAVGLFAYFVWPTRYRQFESGDGPYADQLGSVRSRIDRLTGDVSVQDASGRWKVVPVRRPELLRPDITGPTPSNRTDTRPAQRQMRETESMQRKTDEMTRSATQQARPAGQ